jgi:hypothetical protein
MRRTETVIGASMVNCLLPKTNGRELEETAAVSP